MKTILSAAALMFALAAPATAQTVLVLQWGSAPAARTQVDLTTEQRIELAAEAACEKPFIRNLRGQQLYDACLAEVRAEVEAALAARDAGTELAVR